MYYGEFTCKADVERHFNCSIDEDIIYAGKYNDDVEILTIRYNKLWAFNNYVCLFVLSEIKLQQLIDEVNIGKYWHHVGNLKEAFENRFHVKL